MAQFQPFTFGQDFGNSFASSYLQSQRLKQDQAQFDAKLAEEKNQQSMLQAYRDQQMILEEKKYKSQEADKFVEVKPDDPYNKIGVPVGQQPKSLIDNWMTKYTADQNRELRGEIADQSNQTKLESIAQRTELAGLRNEVTSANIESKKQVIEDKKQERLNKQFEEIDKLLGTAKGGTTKVTVDGKDVPSYIQYGDSKPKPISKETWRSDARGKVESIIRSRGLVKPVASLWKSAKEFAKNNNIDFESQPSSKKREIMKSMLDQTENVDDNDKTALYKYIEVFTR